ncbi:hypothetical protein Pmani_036530 [Petrolisthes manimaculis]|uniref:Uncharacterized protein n=1 Tax=Petrolisthes manimaculis TaxID=1843537 RepID=A0AAE1NJ56_9EUCA|nr:hypothetical protein Pmani_036530 [Petrolisthes manimaculis]
MVGVVRRREVEMVGVVTGEVAGEWRGGPEEVVVDALRQWPAKPIVASGNVATLSLSSTLEGPTHSQGVSQVHVY